MNEQTRSLCMELFALKQRLRDAIAQSEPEPVEDWELRTLDGEPVRLSAFFGNNAELLIVHNMGRHCNYCSLWGDGFIGLADHLQERCSFALCSNDPPEVARAFAEERGWGYPVVSGAGSGFARAMGYADDKGNPHPGISGLHKSSDGSIIRTGDMPFGPGDDFCAIWPMLDLIKGGKGDWEPRHGGKDTPPPCCSSSCDCH